MKEATQEYPSFHIKVWKSNKREYDLLIKKKLLIKLVLKLRCAIFWEVQRRPF